MRRRLKFDVIVRISFSAKLFWVQVAVFGVDYIINRWTFIIKKRTCERIKMTL